MAVRRRADTQLGSGLESNVIEIRDTNFRDEEFELSFKERNEEEANRHPFGMLLGGVVSAWFGVHWILAFTASLKTGAWGAGGILMFVIYPILASLVLGGLWGIGKGLIALIAKD